MTLIKDLLVVCTIYRHHDCVLGQSLTHAGTYAGSRCGVFAPFGNLYPVFK